MTREWKPGDVAIVGGLVALRVEANSRGCSHNQSDHDHWHNVHQYIADFSVAHTNARPLVVIDPEDREQVERLAQALWLHADVRTPTDEYAARVRAVLRKFANPTPPKPEEPTGDGAVVVDRQGHRWVRIAGPPPERESKPWRRRGHTARAWEHVNAVEVLSEGVTP